MKFLHSHCQLAHVYHLQLQRRSYHLWEAVQDERMIGKDISTDRAMLFFFFAELVQYMNIYSDYVH